jgi:hypothetical protein
MLILHIGLPKTGTTTLQSVFRRIPDLAFVHRKVGATEAAICQGLRRYTRTNGLLAPLYAKRIGTRLRTLARGEGATPGDLLISDEDVSVAAGGFWRGAGAVPDLAAGRLASLGRRVDQGFGPVRVIVGIRRQDQWLASRYAESSRMFPGFGQVDFDRRMRRIADGQPLSGPLQWLDYQRVHESFVRALGEENVLLVPLERLGGSPAETLAEVGRFMGGVHLAAGGKRGGPRRGHRNRLSQGENTWRLRRDGTPLLLTPDLEAALRARFAASNAALAAHVALGFEP